MTPLPLAAESLSTTHFEWGRIQTNSDWILPITVCLAVMFFVRYVYRRDAEELGRGLSWGLTALRMAVFYGLLVLYLEPQWRSVRETTRNSRVVLLADTSLSMRQTDAGAQPAEGGMSRAQQLAQVFAGSDLLARLRQTHDVAVLRFDQDVRRVAGLEKRSAEEARGAARSEEDASSVGPEPGEWANLLEPTGTETRLGQALRQVLQEEQGGTLAGVVLFTDGGQNSGLGPEVALQAAREAKVPLFAIGLGSDRLPANVRVSDLTAPPRAYPGDRYTVTGYLQAQKLAGRVVSVELLSRESGDGPGKSLPTSGVVEGTQQVTLGGDGEVVAVAFDLVVGNLYPFGSVSSASGPFEAARQNIDIGGPCMLRAAAKNFLRVAGVCDPGDYAAVLGELRETGGRLGLATRARLARKVFETTSRYDTAIAAFLGSRAAAGLGGEYEVG